MRINSRHTAKDRAEEFYPTPKCAIESLIAIEQTHIPQHLWEPAAGNSDIALPLRDHGYDVFESDIIDRGHEQQKIENYLLAPAKPYANGIITNPPFSLAHSFIEKSLKEVRYSAWLLRLSFLESMGRYKFFNEYPPSRILVSSRRLPMMHRDGWDGKKSTSNVCYAWFIWDDSTEKSSVSWFDWKEYYNDPT